MRLLIVAMADSIHTVRWVNQFVDMGWDIHLFPSTGNGDIHPEFRNITIHSVFCRKLCVNDSKVRVRGIPIGRFLTKAANMVLKRLCPGYRWTQLRWLIRWLQPDILHSMETQAAGYLTVAVKAGYHGKFPPWIHTVWGSDIYLFGRLVAHKSLIQNVIENCDYFICEGQRDVQLARGFGFQGEALLVSQATGGFDIPLCTRLRSPGNVSARRLVMLKGYQSWSGRSLVGLRALERCADLLDGYSVILYSASPDVALAAELFTAKTGVLTVVLPKVSHEKMLQHQGKARLSISLSISDGVPNSLLEAIVMGSFPIQSLTSCADEWIEDGVTGMLVPPEDPDIVEKAIRRALQDDDLVDRAAENNYRLAEARLDKELLKAKALDFYSLVLEQSKREKANIK